MKETVDQFLARGGKIKEIPFGVSGEVKVKLTHKKERYVYDTLKNNPFQNSYKRNF